MEDYIWYFFYIIAALAGLAAAVPLALFTNRLLAFLFETDELIISDAAPGLDYDHAVAAVLDQLYDARIDLPVKLRGAPPLSDNTRRVLDAYARQK